MNLDFKTIFYNVFLKFYKILWTDNQIIIVILMPFIIVLTFFLTSFYYLYYKFKRKIIQ